MRINIFTALNGVGLQRDAYILEKALQGHEITIVDLNKTPRPKRADANIFCEIIKPNFLKIAPKNYFIPNPEWFMMGWQPYLKRMEILNKTRLSQRAFGGEYIGFTSLDFYQPNKVNRWAHFSGKSSYKGTEALIEAWKPEYPELVIKRDRNEMKVQKKNISYQFARLPEEQFQKYFGETLVHFCPSIAEGWGHYIWEAMGAGSVVVTTDGAPMNEYIDDSSLLVKTKGYTVLNKGIKHTIDVKDLQRVVDGLMGLGQSELIEIGQQNRQAYLENDKRFTERIRAVFA